MRSTQNFSFGRTPDVSLPRSMFNRSCGLKTTFDGDYLIPIAVREVLPGDTVNMGVNFFARLSTPIKPLMDNMFIDLFGFYCPARLLWSNFKRFMGEQDNPADSISYNVPVLDHTIGDLSTVGFEVGTLGDYFGLPTDIVALSGINALPFEMYNRIWNEWFRDENTQDSVLVDDGDADRDPDDYILLKRNKKADYFTIALPYAQKWDSVSLPLGIEAPIFGDNMDFDDVQDSANAVQVRDSAGAGSNLRSLKYNGTSGGVTYAFGGLNSSGSGELKADLSEATAATINELREAFQVQKLYERDARGGTRYIELLKSHFGVSSSDRSLQRSELLFTSSHNVNMNAIANTSPIKAADAPLSSDVNQGDLSAFGTSSGRAGFSKSFEEHGYIIVLACARADVTYQQGIERMWSRSTRLDFYWPSLAHLGEQSILNKEIYADASANDDLAFGYIPRYDEYRFGFNKITGQFRSTYATSIDLWHLAEEFGSLPTVQSIRAQNTPFDRVVAVTSAPHFIFDAYFDEKWVRCMPTYSVPGLIDHF